MIDLRQNQVIYSFNNDDFQVSTDTNKAILSPDGRYACAGSQNGSLFVWNTTNGICERVLHRKHTYDHHRLCHSLLHSIFDFLEQW